MISRNSVFVDTAGWISLLVVDDPHHQEVLRQYTELVNLGSRTRLETVITSNYVLSELGAHFSNQSKARSHRYRLAAIKLASDLRRTSYVRIIHISQDEDRQAWQKLQTYVDKDEWSLVDASTFVLMEQLHLGRALTTDHHFEQAGFERLLK